MKNYTQKFIGILALVFAMSFTANSQETADTYLDLPQGWSMFGYTCIDSVDAMVGFSEILDKIEIVKDEWGLAYISEWGFNGLGSLHYSEGYQIKMIEGVTDFQFCEAIVPEDGITQADVDAVQQQLNTANQTISELQAEGDWNYPPESNFWYWNSVNNCLNGESYSCTQAAQILFEYNVSSYNIPYEISGCVNLLQMGYNEMYATDYECPNALNYPELLSSFFGEIESCENDSDEDGVCDVNEISGCQDENAFNYNLLATDDSGDCIAILYGCLDPFACNFSSEVNMDDGSCTYPILDGDNWLNCDLQIGVAYEGGIVFSIDESGEHGLVADFEDLQDGYRTHVWGMYDLASEYTSQGYDDWFLPSVSQFQLLYNTIGPGGDNSANLSLSNPGVYWTSSSQSTGGTGWEFYAFYIFLNEASTHTGGGMNSDGGGYLGRPIRAF